MTRFRLATSVTSPPRWSVNGTSPRPPGVSGGASVPGEDSLVPEVVFLALKSEGAGGGDQGGGGGWPLSEEAFCGRTDDRQTWA